MNTLKYGIFALLVVHAVQAQPNEAEQQYNGIMRDLRLIKKCYISKSSKCNVTEQAEAKVALMGIGKKVAALGLLITGGLLIRAGYRKLMRTAPGQLETPYETHVRKKMLKTQAEQGLTKQSAKGAQGL